MFRSNAETFLQVYQDVLNGAEISPRGLKCLEVIDYKFTLDMGESPFTSFKARNLNVPYAKREMLWYMKGDKFDRSIEEYATMWQKIRQPDGSYFSNYGQYIFPDQFEFVIAELKRDPDSRRASIVLLKKEHLFADNKDVVCTYAINFRIRAGKLDMTVMMRSNDVVFGMTNDVFCFSMLYRMVYVSLMPFVTMSVGTYTHFVNSLHAYERHFKMLREIVDQGMHGYYPVQDVWPTVNEVNGVYYGLWRRWLSEPAN